MEKKEFISGQCHGETCPCGNKITQFKVVQHIFDDDPNQIQHGLSQYLCEDCFYRLMVWDRPYSIQTDVKNKFKEMFGYTSLNERIDDILKEALELNRFTDVANLKEELGDLLSSCLMLAAESDWNYKDLIKTTLEKIDKRKAQYKTLCRKTNIAILGGAFNPVHNGHIELAKFILNVTNKFDEVWLMPSYKHMFKKIDISVEHRVNMLNFAVENEPRIKVSTFEIDNKLSGETWALFKRLLDNEEYKNKYSFSFIIGQDNANDIKKWSNYEYLLKTVNFVVIQRKGVEQNGNRWYMEAPHIYLLNEGNSPIPEISSTEIRKIAYSDLFNFTSRLKYYVNEDVAKYVIDNKLYDKQYIINNEIKNITDKW